MKVIDLTHTITENTPVYPGTKPPTLEPISSYEKDGYKETLITMFSHTGTHMDPPAHLYADRTTLDQFPAEQFIGKALVIDCRILKEGEDITMDPCKKMARDVFPQEQVGAYMNPKFVSIQLDMESEYGAPLAKKLQIQAYPTFVIFNAYAQEIGRFLGGSEAEEFIKLP